jgi:hypothetical protein
MTDTTGNFQDLVQLSADTLYDLGEDLIIGNSAASTVTFGMSNSAGSLAVAAAPTANQTLWLPSNNGTLLSAINVSAGTTSNNLSAVVFSNSNGVTFGLNGSTVTASAAGAGGGGVDIAAGTQTATSGTVVFSNSNGFTFGMSGSSIVTLATSATDILISNLAVYESEYSNGSSGASATINWNNGNKQTITLNAATVTLSFTAPSFSGGSTANVLLRVVQDGAGNRTIAWTGGGLVINWVGGVAPTLSTAANAVDIISLYYNGTSWYGSYGTNFATSGVPVSYITNINVSAGTTSNNLSNVVFSNSNNVSFGLSVSTITASVTVASTQASINFSAGTTSNNLSAITFSNSNNVSFGLNGSTMTGSVATSLTKVNISAGTTSQNLSNCVYSNSNNVSFGLNGSTITGSFAFNISGGTTSNNLSAVTFSNSNNVSFGLNGSTLTGSFALNVSAGTTSNNLSAVTFSNSNGISFGLNASTITAKYGGFSNWQNGAPVTSFASSNGFLSLQPIVVPYAITVTRIIFLASLSNGTTNSSGAISVNVGLYTLTGGTSGTMSLASSASSQLSWTSGGAYSSSSAIGYQQMTVNSWALTPGAYLFGMAVASSNVTVTFNLYGTASFASVASNFGTAMSSMPWLPGFSGTSVTICPATVGVTNTASWIRSGSSVFQQPWVSFQGT